MRKLAGVVLVVMLSGCSHTMQLMAREGGGQIYQGQIKEGGIGSGTLSVSMGGNVCSGNYSKVASGDTFGFVQTYGPRGSALTTSQTFGSSQYKALIACSDGNGLRCDIVGRASGVGICVDNANRVYDLLYSQG